MRAARYSRRMRTAAVVTLALAAALPAAPAAAAPLAKARTVACDGAAGTATFRADLRHRPGADRLQVGFGLLMLRDGRWQRVRAPGLGRWRTSQPGVARYVYTKTVDGLVEPGAYRAVVRFRWLDAAGVVLDRTVRRTSTCRRPDLRPDLQPVAFERRNGGWVLVVRNAGRAGAGRFGVALTVDGRTRPVEVAGLAAGATVEIPAADGCPERLEAVVDGDGRVDERDDDDNVLVADRPCSTPV